MAAGVVDDLELVEVEEHQRMLAALAEVLGLRAFSRRCSNSRRLASWSGCRDACHDSRDEFLLAGHVVQHQHGAGHRAVLIERVPVMEIATDVDPLQELRTCMAEDCGLPESG
jgi:hypothetical protein